MVLMPDGVDTIKGRASHSRSVIIGGIWNNLGALVPLAINVALTPYVIHGFGVKRWGLYVLISALSMFLSPLGGGAAPTVGRFFSLYAANKDREATTRTLYTALVVTLAIGVGVTIITWFIASPVLGLFGASKPLTHEGLFMFRTLGVVVAAGLSHNVFAALVNSHQFYALTNLANSASYFAWALGMVVSVHWRYGLRGAALALAAQQVVNTLLIVPNATRYFSLRPRLLSWAETKVVLKFAGSLQVMSITTLINSQFDSVLIGAVFTLPDLTYFNTGSNFAQQLRGMATNFLQPATIHLARTFGAHGAPETESEFRRLQTVWVIGVSGFSAAVLGSCYFAVVAWLGPSFTLAGEVVVLAMVGNTINLWTGMLNQYMSAVGRPDLELRYAIVSVILNIAFTVPLVLLGPLGVGGATVVGVAGASLYLLRIVRKHYRKDIPSFLHDVPYLAIVVTAALTAALEFAIKPLVVYGPLGLLVCAIPGGIGILVFAAIVLRSELRNLIRLALARKLRPRMLVDVLAPPEGLPRPSQQSTVK
jgi:O-antigen/teichoic acid export membrane protein